MNIAPSPLLISHLKCEHLSAPLAIDDRAPRFSWIVSGDGFDRAQSAFRILVHGGDGTIVWDSGVRKSNATGEIAYEGTPLTPLTAYIWTVEVWDENHIASLPGSSTFSTGLLKQKWDAQWIAVPPSKGAKPPEATLAYRNPFRALNVSNFRKEFTLPDKIKSAHLYATALGTYRFFINGQRVGDDLLTPSFTDYNKRLEYQAYDISSAVNQGKNAIAALLGEGWYAGFLGLDMKRPGSHWGRKPQLSAFAIIELENGDIIRFETDGSWKHFIGGLIYSDMLKGEKFDARMYPQGWDKAHFDDQTWDYAGSSEGTDILICAAKSPPVKHTHSLKAKSVKQAPDGAWIFDLGQNMVGYCSISFNAEADQTVRLVHAEMLDDDGNLYLENLRTAVQEDIYVAADTGRKEYTPTFTFHGFQYVGVYGLSDTPNIDDLVGIVINNDLPETSTFDSSSALLNQLHSNIVWSQRGNFVSVPTDCPQRDERLGWSADGQIFAPTAVYNMDISAFFDKWLDDIVDGQTEEGAFMDVAPAVGSTGEGAPAWGDAGVILPLLLHETYADKRIVERMYGPMKKWVEFIRRNNPDYLRINRNHANYGDWLAIGQETPNELVATAYYAWLAKLMLRAAETLEIREDQAFYSTLYACISEAYVKAYIRDDGTIGSGSQTSYLLSLFVGLVPEHLVEKSVTHLVENIHHAGDKVQVGFLGVRHVCPILSEHGHADLAYRLATSTDFPSWGYSVVNGATTIWERWDGWTKDAGFQVPNMNSFNHYAYGAIGEWMFAWMAGIAPDPNSAGYQHFTLRPTPDASIDYCHATYQSPRGKIVSNWSQDNQNLTYNIQIPANTRATLEVLANNNASFTLNTSQITPKLIAKYGKICATFEIGSGIYELKVRNCAENHTQVI